MSTKASVGTFDAFLDRLHPMVSNLPANSIFISEVIDCVAHCGVMRVTSPLRGPINAVAVHEHAHQGYGARKVGVVYPPHTKVLCYKPPIENIAYIIGALPTAMTDGVHNMMPDWITPGSNSGLGYDRVHWEAIISKNDKRTTDANYSGGSPCDAVSGDAGNVNELGVGYGIGRTMAWLRASHFCGIEAHWVDNLLRVMAFNLEELTTASERRITNDEGEHTEVKRWNPYPWEAMGVADTDKDAVRAGNGRWGDPSLEAGYEPIYPDQAGIWRVQEFNGYLGDLHRLFVSMPVLEQYPGGIERQGLNTVSPGLLDIGYSVDGHYHVRSAKGISLEKSVVLPIPKEKLAPDDATGDTSENYRPAGKGENGESHDRTEPVIENDRPGMRSMLAWELHALLYAFTSNLPFIRHEKDWFLPTEAHTLSVIGLQKAGYDPSEKLSVLKFWMPLPKYVELNVDHRGTTRYYSGKAMVQLSDDGSIILEDAYGSQIRMEGGNIFISARNDVVVQPGKSAQIWAPNDAIIKAGNAVDITSSLGDVRVKAQNNLMMVSVNKGVLIEAQDDGRKPNWKEIGTEVDSTGITLKAANSTLRSYTNDAYLRAGVNGSAGNFHIDCGEGKGRLALHAGTITQRALNRAHAIVGSTGASENTVSFDLTTSRAVIGGKNLSELTLGAKLVDVVNETGDSTLNVNGGAWINKALIVGGAALIREGLEVGNSLLIHGNVLVDGDAIFKGSVLSEGFAADKGGWVGELSDKDKVSKMEIPKMQDKALKAAIELAQIAAEALKTARTQDNQAVTDYKTELYADDSKFGSRDIINYTGFSYRTAEQYGTSDDFVWFEARWQQMNRLLPGDAELWNETSIDSPYGDLPGMPFPGNTIWAEQDSFLKVDPKFYDMSLGISTARDVEDKTLPAPIPCKMAENYLITYCRGNNV